MNAKGYLEWLENHNPGPGNTQFDAAKIQALIELREAVDRLTAEVRAGRNKLNIPQEAQK